MSPLGSRTQRELQRRLREVLPHEAQRVAMHRLRPVVLVAQHEEQLGLDAADLQVLHGEEADLQQVLQLAAQLALVVDDHLEVVRPLTCAMHGLLEPVRRRPDQVRAGHGHQGQLRVEDAAALRLAH